MIVPSEPKTVDLRELAEGMGEDRHSPPRQISEDLLAFASDDPKEFYHRFDHVQLIARPGWWRLPASSSPRRLRSGSASSPSTL
jgi:hypothetical protein